MKSNIPNYDATFCGKLPIHQTNLIQPHGVLILLDSSNLMVLQVSENITSLTGVQASAFVNHSLATFIKDESFQILKKNSAHNFEGKKPLTLSFKNGDDYIESNVFLLSNGDQLIVEAELQSYIPSSQNSFVQVYQSVKNVMLLINEADSIQEVYHIAAKKIKELSGFDKVMVYEFDENWNGTVKSESKEEGMEAFINFTFPASDIPKPARDLYMKNPYRIIPNREYEPVRLYPVFNPKTHTFTNLGQSDLRSVASVHLEYLKNMDVIASMSTRIIHNENLWGLIACHHREPKYLSFEQGSVFELLSTVISSKISSLINKESFQVRQTLNNSFTQLVQNIADKKEIVPALLHNEALLKNILGSNSIAFCYKGEIKTIGTTPDKLDLENLCIWLQHRAVNSVYHQPALPHYFDESAGYAEIGSGLLALPIQSEKNHFVLAFRPEIVKNVTWGGNPNDALSFEKDSLTYHPRNSFKMWREEVMQTAKPWREEEIAIAETFRNYLVEHTLNNIN